MMNNFMMNYKYNMKSQSTKALWYLTIYPSIMVIVYISLIKTGIFSEADGSFINRIWGSVIFLFAVFIKFKEDFDFLMTMSSTRLEIFLGKMATALTFSFVFSFIILLEKVITDRLNEAFNFHNISDPLHFWAPYASNSMFGMFMYFFAMCLLYSIGGIFLGTLFYRYGNKFVTIFWLVFSAIPSIFLPFLMWVQYKNGALGNNMSALGSYLRNFNLYSSALVMIIFTIGFFLLTWVNMRRLPQN